MGFNSVFKGLKQADVFGRYLVRHSDVGGVNRTLHATTRDPETCICVFILLCTERSVT